jgi:hypothetical protein
MTVLIVLIVLRPLESAYLCGLWRTIVPELIVLPTVLIVLPTAPCDDQDDGRTVIIAMTVLPGIRIGMRIVAMTGRSGRSGRSFGTLLTPNLQLPTARVRSAPDNEHTDFLQGRCQAVELFGELVGLLGPVPGALHIVPNPLV